MQPSGELVEPTPELSQQPKRRRSPATIVAISLAVIGIGLAATGYVVLRHNFGYVVIPTRAMAPTLVPGDEVMIRNGSGTPHRGDIVLIDASSWSIAPSGANVLKRVIGLPGDTLMCCDGQNRLVVNGHPVFEGYVQPDPVRPDQSPYQPFQAKVPAGQVFVAGDNRADSADSRFFGPLPEAGIRGTALTVERSVAAPGVATSLWQTGYEEEGLLAFSGAALGIAGIVWLVIIGVRALVRRRRARRSGGRPTPTDVSPPPPAEEPVDPEPSIPQ